jgi:hypothetical protein
MAVRIAYPTDTPWGSQVAAYASAVTRAQALGARLMGALNSMGHDGAGPFDDLEAELGLEAGLGIELYQTVNVAQQALAAIDIAPVDQGTG